MTADSTSGGAGGARRRARVRPVVALLALAAAAALGIAASPLLPSRADLREIVSPRVPDLSAIDAPLRAAASEFSLDPDLLRGLVAAESGGNRHAKSGAGAVGLLQLLPSTAGEHAAALGLDPKAIDLEDAATNLRLGARHLRRLVDQFDGEVEFAIAAYNAGAEPMKRWRLRAVDASPGEVIRREAFAETRTHVERVLKYRDAYR